jgi:hypothetical protein
MKADRVGIITFHSTTNHGASLQALGLTQVLRQMGYDPEVIDYRPPAAERYYRGECWKRNRLANALKFFRFAQFATRKLPLSPQRCDSLSDLRRWASSRYPTLVCGSDQIWHVNRGFRPFDPAYYLEFSDSQSVRKISYGPSFGTPAEVQPHADRIRTALERFHAISVRDESSRRCVQDLVGREAVVVADPTLLTEFSVAELPPLARATDVFYGGNALEASRRAMDWSHQQGGTLLCLAHAGPSGSRQRISLGPLAWIQEIRRSRMVFTTTFHGTLFAVKYGRPFVAMTHPWNLEKIKDFTQRTGLNHRLLDATDLPRCLPSSLWDPADVVEARSHLQRHVQLSLDYLRSALQASTAPAEPRPSTYA